jgi:acyl-CoA thioester hydrolase
MTPEASTRFQWPIRVYYEDTDAGGVVYHANYINFMERARTELLRSLGYELDVLEREQRIVFAVRRIAVEFLKPARLNELLSVSVAIDQVRPASLLFRQGIHRGEEPLCEGEVKVASLSADTFRPRVVPDELKARLESLLG